MNSAGDKKMVNAQIVTLTDGCNWLTFSTVRGTETATMRNSLGEKLTVSLADAKDRTQTLVRAGWKVVRSLSLAAA